MYIAENIRLIGENTAMYAGGKYMQERWADILHPPKIDERSCDEITAEFIERCGLVVV